jgi:hypothetical protein
MIESASHQGSAPKPIRRPPRLRLLVPAYFYPAGNGLREWERLIAAAAQVPIIAIANPATGPGEKVDPNYQAVLERAARGKVVLIGYVNTDYARRPRADVEQDIARWVRLYPRIKGIFFDLQPSSAEHVGYYQALRRFVRARIPRALVATNPGTLSAPEYVARAATDLVCLFENKEGFPQFKMPPWTRRYPAERFCILAYAVSETETMRRYVTSAREQGAGTIYVTDATGENPWDRLPRYWNDEVALVREANASGR